MSKRLTGLNPLAYIGVEPVQPVNTFMRNFAPGPTDSRNVNIGDFWIDTATQTLWVLVSLAGGNATWISLPGGSADSFVTDSGTAVPSGGILNVNGDGVAINTTGSGNTIHVNIDANPSFGNVTVTGLSITGFTDGVLVSNNSGVIGEVTTTNHSLLVGNASGTISSLGVATNGQLPIGSTGANPVLATITAGTGISVTNGAGSITIAATGAVAESFATDSGTAIPAAGVLTIHGGTGITTSGSGSTVTITSTGAGFPYTDEAISFNALSNNGYFVSAIATATMPAFPSEGDRIEFIVDTTSVLTITANTGQVLRIGAAVSASAGTAASNARGDAVSFIYRSADTAWIALSVIGTWTVT